MLSRVQTADFRYPILLANKIGDKIWWRIWIFQNRHAISVGGQNGRPCGYVFIFYCFSKEDVEYV